ncbi:hypothetical protein B0J14DRAFT_239617 [Halenospora varia]|nr:hypothetical protein B0J14DRAFT_239617 [Halenospora varia]
MFVPTTTSQHDLGIRDGLPTTTVAGHLSTSSVIIMAGPTPAQGAIIGLSIVSGLLILGILFFILLYWLAQRQSDEVDNKGLEVVVRSSHRRLRRRKRRRSGTHYSTIGNDGSNDFLPRRGIRRSRSVRNPRGDVGSAGSDIHNMSMGYPKKRCVITPRVSTLPQVYLPGPPPHNADYAYVQQYHGINDSSANLCKSRTSDYTSDDDGNRPPNHAETAGIRSLDHERRFQGVRNTRSQASSP